MHADPLPHFLLLPSITLQDYRQSRGLRLHATHVIRMLGKLVGGLSNLSSVMPVLLELGRTHSMLSIRPEYFDVMRECLLDTLAEVNLQYRHTSIDAWEQ